VVDVREGQEHRERPAERRGHPRASHDPIATRTRHARALGWWVVLLNAANGTACNLERVRESTHTQPEHARLDDWRENRCTGRVFSTFQRSQK
jgi:hypothetical protein